MADSDYQRYKFSVTCHTDDLAVVHCLRSLCEFAEQSGRRQIGWGGTKKSAWLASANQITLRFTDPAYREAFVLVATWLLPTGSWSVVRKSDKDPARRQREKRWFRTGEPLR